ncbi:FAD-dependent oxidoreductase [Omnitrophica bacterium]|nr:FAD-dependent oxidoreductase [Candidatus Omnitrophota bacterium]
MSSNEDPFKLAVIGGGIAGAGIARDAAMRGIRVVLFEKNTFGSGTSSKSSKLIHGGIRYLELAWNALKQFQLKEFFRNLRFVSESLKESYYLEQMAPDLVQPICLCIPVYKNRGRSFPAVVFGACFYGFLARLAKAKKGPEILGSSEAVLKRIPQLRKENLRGAVMIWDHISDDRKLVIQTMQSAIRHGATAFEKCPVESYRYLEDRNLYEIKTSHNGQARLFYAHKLINASGPWVDKVRQSANEKTKDYILPVAGSHITLEAFTEHSVILQARDNRVFFVIQFGGRARVGTTEWIHRDPDCISPREEDIQYLTDSLTYYFPEVSFDSKKILSSDCGIRPLAKPQKSLSPTEISREHEVRIGPSGVLHVLGVKLTDHRRAAEQIIDSLIADLGKDNPAIKKKSATAKTPLTN